MPPPLSKRPTVGKRLTVMTTYLLFGQVASSREAPHVSWAQELDMHTIPGESIPEEPPVGVHCI